MTESTTPVEAVRQVNRNRSAATMRVLADLHAAYGKGVSLDINAASTIDAGDQDRATWVYLVSDEAEERAIFGFWDDGDVTTSQTAGWSSPGTEDIDHVEALDRMRAFIHKHGQGAR